MVHAGQFIAFAKRLDSDLPCNGDGEPFADPAAATCLVFDGFDEARRWTDAAARRLDRVRFDVFDHQGRINPPLLTVVHPSRRESLEGSARALRRQARLAAACVAVGVPLMVYAYSISSERDPILPGFIGLNLVLIALRLLWMNLASREIERARLARVARVAGAGEPSATIAAPYDPAGR